MEFTSTIISLINPEKIDWRMMRLSALTWCIVESLRLSRKYQLYTSLAIIGGARPPLSFSSGITIYETITSTGT